MRKKTLVSSVLIGLAVAANLQATTIPVSAKSLYQEYQESQAQEANARAARDNVKYDSEADAEKQTDTEKEDAGSTIPKKSGEMSVGDFNDRIRAILNSSSSGSNKYSRFASSSMTPDDSTENTAPVVVSNGDSKNSDKNKPAVHETKPVAHESEAPVDNPVQTLPPIPPQPQQDPKPVVSERHFNFDWKGTPLPQSLYMLGSMAGKGIVINGELKGNVYVHVNQETCNHMLDYLAAAYGFNWMLADNTIVISTDNKMLQSEVFEVSYANKAKLKEEMTALGIDAAKIYANTETGTLSVTATPYQLAEVRKRLAKVDRPIAQCLLAVQLIEISHGKSLDLGLTYTLPTYSHEGNETGDGSSFKGPWLDKLTFGASAKAERALSKGKVISRPILLAKNGEKSNVLFGDRVPIFSTTSTNSATNITVSYKDVGTNLDITPVINEKTGDVSLNINAEVSNITSYLTSGAMRAPQISTRNITTTAHVKSGQSLIIGGMMSATDIDNLTGIPGLMNLPILGSIFRYHQRSRTYAEVFIMMTPYIMADGLDAQEIARRIQK